jgi:23S rRNA (uracil1939-C5)-methyltransferase
VPIPWWLSHVAALETPLAAPTLGALWSLKERCRFVRDNVEPALLALDVAGNPEAATSWTRFLHTEREVRAALERATTDERRTLSAGGRPPAEFRAHWEGLGFVPHEGHDGSPADDYLDALFGTSRLSYESSDAAHANVNLGSRAARVSDFLTVTRPGARDVVFDLGSGSGKLANTVAASAVTSVLGVELLGAAVADANGSARAIGLSNVAFHEADVRDVDLSAGSIFYLYFPFSGAVASAVAQTLGGLARRKAVCIYASGPLRDYGEFFLREVDDGALTLDERRGEFGEVMVLRSAGPRRPPELLPR